MAGPSYLIINADDNGYSDGISRGILKAVECGTVKATGILANSPNFERHIKWLAGYQQLDVGVHLTLTSGRPLSDGMTALMRATGEGDFISNKFSAALSILSKKIPLHIVEEEWDLQIKRCVGSGINILFVNSHEHIHGLPPLFSLVQNLAEKYDIPHVRVPSPEWFSPYSLGSLVRSMVMMGLGWLNDTRKRENEPELIGISCSGKLNKRYIEKRIVSLRPGKTYELMCHPGYYTPGEITDRNLLSYHDWAGELRTLCDKHLVDQLKSKNINVIGYRDL